MERFQNTDVDEHHEVCVSPSCLEGLLAICSLMCSLITITGASFKSYISHNINIKEVMPKDPNYGRPLVSGSRSQQIAKK